MTKAWHLRQDGKAFPVKVHMYCMEDDDLSSEAECAAFIIKSDSKDQGLAQYVLDAWMALLIEQEVSYDADSEAIDNTIKEVVSHLPYHFQYSLSAEELLNIHRQSHNYDDVDTLYEFCDRVRDELTKIQTDIKRSINQQFCRVRYGGQYNSVAGNNEIWFRVSSVDYNWANTIYIFTSSIHRSYRISQITICRDSESDEGFHSDSEYFYKAKDGTLYKHMPIEEYLEEEHEYNPVFESINLNEGVLYTAVKLLKSGMTYSEVMQYMKDNNVEYSKDIWDYLRKRERSRECVSSYK